MDIYTKYYELVKENEELILIIFVLLCILFLVVIRNWYNLFRKRSFRKKNRLLTQQIEASKFALSKYDEQLNIAKNLEAQLSSKELKIVRLQKQIETHKKDYNSTLTKKEHEIAKKQEALELQKGAYEKTLDYKNIEANNTRLGAHFIKNVISQIYDDLEQTEYSYKSFLGIHYRIGESKAKIPSIKALKNIFKLLDYNVSALNKEHTTVDEELKHIDMFLELIQYLKPNAKIDLTNSLSVSQKDTIKIKPTLFFPFVENALKHGSLNEENSFISIVLKENKQKQLSYCLVNSADDQLDKTIRTSNSSKFGLKALQDLINAYYPGSELKHDVLPNNQYMSQLILKIA